MAATATLLGCVAVAGCGLGPGESSEGEADLVVTRDYGAERIAETTVTDPTESDTVMRVLDSAAEITTRYGGGFVQSIGGIEGSAEVEGRTLDWFFYVDGIESPVGATDVPVEPGDRVWWDYRDWTDAQRVPAVVGSYPRPLAGEGVEDPVALECSDSAIAACRETAGRLEDAGAELDPVGVGEADPGAVRVLVGPWDEIGRDPVAASLEGGPGESGVFATPSDRGGDASIELLDQRAEVAETPAQAGLLAATRRGEGPYTLIVTGTDATATEDAATLLDETTLRDRYAVAAVGGDAVPLPVAGEGG
ncbi:DUF4430 domain-containing protein [Thermoleophilia bacterium SCSIO 60948]|nr:DUF4430 domain-containing protein [Thermoleophilia bacterium SCSIO 60948]